MNKMSEEHLILHTSFVSGTEDLINIEQILYSLLTLAFRDEPAFEESIWWGT